MCRSLCFNKAKGRRLATLFKKRLCEFCRIFKNMYFVKHLQMAASENNLVFAKFTNNETVKHTVSILI